MSDESDEIEALEEAGRPLGTEVAVGSAAEEESAAIEVPRTLPILPLKNTVLFPFLLSPLLVSSERSKRLIDAVVLDPHRLLVCLAVRRPVEASPGPDDVHRIGTVVRIVKMLKSSDDSYRLLVQGVARAAIQDFVAESPFLKGNVEVLRDSGDLGSVETAALTRAFGGIKDAARIVEV